LSHSASFESCDKNAPSNAGTKQLDEFVPGGRQPAFLTGSQLRPLFSAAGQRGITSLPADAVAVIDQLKKERRI